MCMHARGATLIDALVATGLFVLVFVGITNAFKLSLDMVTNNKARSGATALADERMEYIRSLPYANVGTVGGIPSGSIPQSESVTLNNISYTRRTAIFYAEDPADGDASVDTDYKQAKVDISWQTNQGIRHITIVTRISPPGIETNVAGGALMIKAINASGMPVAGASVSVVNAGASPPVNINTYTNTQGIATVLGAPVGAGYAIVVSSQGYSTAQTYSATPQNTSPNPGNLSVALNQTTTGTFAIDLLSTKIIRTWTQVLSGAWADQFSDTSKIATSSGVSVQVGRVQLAGNSPYPSSGFVESIAIAPSSLNSWQMLYATSTLPAGTSIAYRAYDASGSALIPDSQLPGNSAGITTTPIDLSHISTTTYSAIRLNATLASDISSSYTPVLSTWSVAYTYGPLPLANITFNLQGAKSIGSGGSGTIYKYSSNFSSGSSGTITIPNLEWDSYTITNTTAAYDIASACNPQPESLSPNTFQTTNLYFVAHTANSLLVDVRSAATGALISGASVSISRPGYSASSVADSCGQSLFGGISPAGDYMLNVTASGQQAYVAQNVMVSGSSVFHVSMN